MYNFLPEPSSKDFLDVILRMAKLAEYREGNISNHLERVRSYCQILAKDLNLPSQDAEFIALASQLHDIGKITIPDRMINKSDNLNPDEWEIIKSHTTVGANLLKGSPSKLIQTGELIAATHHERWNGSGYPRGLMEKEIPIAGRIVALADVFDALTTKRSYKDEVSPDEAKDLVLDYRGELFDPKIVDIFKSNFSEIKKIRQKIN